MALPRRAPWTCQESDSPPQTFHDGPAIPSNLRPDWSAMPHMKKNTCTSLQGRPTKLWNTMFAHSRRNASLTARPIGTSHPIPHQDHPRRDPLPWHRRCYQKNHGCRQDSLWKPSIRAQVQLLPLCKTIATAPGPSRRQRLAGRSLQCLVDGDLGEKKKHQPRQRLFPPCWKNKKRSSK